MTKTIALSFVEGRVVRDLFENGFLKMLRDQNIEVVLFTPAANVPSFVNQWKDHVKAIEYHPIYTINNSEHRLLKIRDKIKTKFPFLLETWMKLEYKLYKTDNHYETLLKKHGCDFVIITHPTHSFEMPLFKAARKLNLPVLGILRSWDNLHKGLRIRPDKLTVWNEVNYKEALTMMNLTEDRVVITGGSQFDAYFSDYVKQNTREEFAKSYGLDPKSPIIMVATLGCFLHFYDETYLIDFLIESIEKGDLPHNTQMVIRLHPTTKYEFFEKYKKYPNIRLSYITGNIPSLHWTMTRKEVEEIGCLMKHADVVISPGSTITIETAIFDTPTIVPVFHHYQPALGEEMFGYHFKTHFKKLQDDDLVPFVYHKEDLCGEIKKCLQDKTYYQSKRHKLAADYIHSFDGKSTQRIADLIGNSISK